MQSLRISKYLLYCSILLGVGFIAKEVSFFYLFIFLLSLAIGILTDEEKISPLKNWIVTLIIIPLILLSILQMKAEVFFNKVLEILIVLICAKLIIPKKQKDLLQLYLLALLLVAGSAVCRWGLEFGLLITLEAFLLINGLLFLYSSKEKQKLSPKEVKLLFIWGTGISVVLYPLTFFFFVMLPRSTFAFIPAWAGGKVTKSGFGEKISPADVEKIKTDYHVALRVKWIKGKRPLQNELYWRGRVYHYYHEGIWYALEEEAKYFPNMKQGESITYKVIVEPYGGSSLFTLGLPISIKTKGFKVKILQGATLKIENPLEGRLLYLVRSKLPKAFPQDGPLNMYLQIPDKVKKAILPFTKKLKIQKGSSSSTKIAKKIQRLLKSDYSYSISPEIKDEEPVVTFLTKTKKGHCELFASSMVLLLRAMGIPARVVAGYYGGEWNGIGGYYIVRRSNAHAWVEVYEKNKGWVLFDPTPASATSLSKIHTSPFYWKLIDALRLKWYEWVVSYDLQKQKKLAEQFFSAVRTPSTRIKFKDFKRLIFILLITSVVFIIFIFVLREYHKKPKSLGERLLIILEKKGYKKRPGDTLLDVAFFISPQNPTLAKAVEEFVKDYYLLEYGGKKIKKEKLINTLIKIKKLR